MKKIKFNPKDRTNSNNQYVTVYDKHMKELMCYIWKLQSKAGEKSVDIDYVRPMIEPNRQLYGKRGKTAKINPNMINNALSVLGGLVTNYLEKPEFFINDLSTNQLECIENAVNILAEMFDMEPIAFEQELFEWN